MGSFQKPTPFALVEMNPSMDKERTKGSTFAVSVTSIWALPVRGGWGSQLNPSLDGLGQLFWEEFA